MSIYGNNFLISIAWKAKSPTQAAKVAQLMGCDREQVREVRNAAALKRDKGEDAFRREFDPFEVVDVDINSYDKMKLRLHINKTHERRPLNAVEFNQVAKIIQDTLLKYGVDVEVEKKRAHPYVKSTLD